MYKVTVKADDGGIYEFVAGRVEQVSRAHYRVWVNGEIVDIMSWVHMTIEAAPPALLPAVL